MSTVAQLSADIASARAPVLFLDTCAILDVARAPRSNPGTVSAADELVRAARASPPAVYFLVADVVQTEWHNNIDSAVDDAAKAVSAAEKVLLVSQASGFTGLPVSLPTLVNLPDELRQRCKDLLDSCRIIDRFTAAVSAAIDRAIAERRPSHKKHVKDSYILEHCLAVARELVGTGFARPMYFVSSNTSDFAVDRSTPTVHPDLRSEFGAAGLTYAASLEAVVALLRAGGHIP